MKKLIIMTALSFIATTARCPYSTIRELIILRPEPAHLPDKMLEAFILQESGGNRYAYNPKETACGILQIRRAMIDEANRIAGWQKYSLVDAWDESKSREIWYLVQGARNPKYSLRRAVSIWQGKFNLRYYASVIKKIKSL